MDIRFETGGVVSTGTVAPAGRMLVGDLHVPKTRAGFVDIDDVVRERESTPEGRASMARARAAIAERLSALFDGTLRSYRLQRGLSQAALAALCRTTQAQIARIEQAKVDAQVSTVLRIGEALGLSDEESMLAYLAERRKNK